MKGPTANEHSLYTLPNIRPVPFLHSNTWNCRRRKWQRTQQSWWKQLQKLLNITQSQGWSVCSLPQRELFTFKTVLVHICKNIELSHFRQMKGWGWSQWTEWDGCFFFIISRFSTFVTFFQPTSFVYFRCGSCPRPACPSSCRMRCRWRQEGLLSLLKGSVDILMIEISQVLPWSLRWPGQLCGNMFL